MPPTPEVVRPPIVEWTLTAKKTAEQRVFYQSELTIDAEVALLTLASKSMARLVEMDFPIGELANLQKEDGDLDLQLAATLVAKAGPLMPSIASESATILFGYLPTDDYGRRDPAYDETVAFVRSALGIAQWYEVIQTFMGQNDVQRMIAPFGEALKQGVALGLWAERARDEAPTKPKPRASMTSTTRG